MDNDYISVSTTPDGTPTAAGAVPVRSPPTGHNLLIRLGKYFTALTVAVFLAGCVATPEPLTDSERAQRVSDDLARIFADHEPVAGPITLSEAMARAIKYNLEYRVKLMSSAVAMRNIDVANMDLLPDLTASAGYFDRDNDSGGSSQSLLTGQESLEPSTSQERERVLTGMTVAWNVLDFGVSYVTAKQRQDEFLIAEEQKRKTIQNIMQEVTDAYWHAWSAQELLAEIENLVIEADRAIETSRSLVARGLQRKQDGLLYQRQMLETRSELWELQDSLIVAQTRLSSLMNIRPGTPYRIAEPDVRMPTPFRVSADELELTALTDRPELHEEDYRLRIKRLDVRKSILRMFPGIEISAGAHNDTNKFLFNQQWNDVSLRLSWNLLNIFSGLASKKFHEAEVLLADMRRMALSMAVMTQVRLSLQRYELARVKYRAAVDVADVNERYLRMVTNNRQTTTEFDVIQARAVALNSTLRRYLAYAETQNALSRVFNSIGADPVPASVRSHELALLSDSIARHSSYLMASHLVPASVPSRIDALPEPRSLAQDVDPEDGAPPLRIRPDLVFRTNLPGHLEIGPDLATITSIPPRRGIYPDLRMRLVLSKPMSPRRLSGLDPNGSYPALVLAPRLKYADE